MLKSSGPTNISGNKVSTSIFMLEKTSSTNGGHKRAATNLRRFLLDDFNRATQTFFRAAREQERSNRVNRHSLFANYFSNIVLMQAQLINRQPIFIDGVTVTASG